MHYQTQRKTFEMIYYRGYFIKKLEPDHPTDPYKAEKQWKWWRKMQANRIQLLLDSCQNTCFSLM